VQTTNGTASAHCPSTGDSYGFSPFGMLFVHRPSQLKTAHLMFATQLQSDKNSQKIGQLVLCVILHLKPLGVQHDQHVFLMEKRTKKHLQVKYYGVHSSVTTKQLGAPHGTENGSFHFGSLCLLQTLVLCQSVFKMQ